MKSKTPSAEKRALAFKIYGPLRVKCLRRPGGRILDEDAITIFWREHSGHARRRGCYVFAVRSGGGTVPGYVGKATRSFRQEVFTHDKLSKYYPFMALYQKGSPVLFFVVAEGVGRPNGRLIGKCERYLIRLAARASPDLINKHGVAKSDFVIPHVTDYGRGRPSAATRESQKALLLKGEGPHGQYQHAESVP